MDTSNIIQEVDKQTSKEEQIILMHEKGASKEDIITTCGVTRQYVNRVLSKNAVQTYGELNIPNYLRAVRNEYSTDSELAKRFGVSRQTLAKFKQETNITARIVCYYYARGYTYQYIGRIAHIKVSSIDKFIIPEREFYKYPPTVESLRKDLIQVISTFEDMAEFDNKTAVDLGTLKRVLEKLQNMTL